MEKCDDGWFVGELLNSFVSTGSCVMAGGMNFKRVVCKYRLIIERDHWQGMQYFRTVPAPRN